jgi:hypothetical protein
MFLSCADSNHLPVTLTLLCFHIWSNTLFFNFDPSDTPPLSWLLTAHPLSIPLTTFVEWHLRRTLQLNYILLMISNRKTVADIREELVELLGEDEAGQFTAALELELKRQQEQQQIVAEREAAFAPLDGSGAAGKAPAKDASSGQGGRGKRDRDEANHHAREPNDRSRDTKDRRQDHDQTGKDKRMRGPISGDDQAGHFPSSSSQRNPPSQPTSGAMGGMTMGAMGFNPAQMRQQMEAMAQMAGFASAEAMMAAQQQMLLSMAAGGRGFIHRGGGGGSGGSGGGRGRTGRGVGDGRLGGRGFGGRNAPAAAPAPTVFVPEKARSYVAPHLQEAQKETKKEKAAAKAPPAEFVPKALDEATLASMSAEDRARHTHPAYADFDEDHEPMGAYGGRGGRGRGGRGAPARGAGRGAGWDSGRGRGRGRGAGRGWGDNASGRGGGGRAVFDAGLSAER